MWVRVWDRVRVRVWVKVRVRDRVRVSADERGDWEPLSPDVNVIKVWVRVWVKVRVRVRVQTSGGIGSRYHPTLTLLRCGLGLGYGLRFGIGL